MNGTILIVDDNPDHLEALEEILTAEGHAVYSVANGEAALKAASAIAPGLILLESATPGVDGFEVCRGLKADPVTASIPVLFVSSQSAPEQRIRAFECGCVDYITRPFIEQEVATKVRTHLRLSSALDQLLRANRDLSGELEACRTTEEKCREDNLRVSQILHRISVPTFVIDTNHTITHWNRALENLTGVTGADMIGTRGQWRLFYPARRATLADLIVDDASETVITEQYGDKTRKSSLMEKAYEATDFFPELGDTGRWLFFTAAPLTDSTGNIIGAIETLQDISEQKRIEEELRVSEHNYMEMSITDSLTKLYNSRHFFRQLQYETERSKRYGIPLSLMLLDVDNFKSYNDTYGHPEGDTALRILADVIKRNLRASDTAYRYGGEEFTVLLPETSAENAAIIAERLRRDFENEELYPGTESAVHMTVSIGVTQYLFDEMPTVFLKRVDETMYRAKKTGKNMVLTG